MGAPVQHWEITSNDYEKAHEFYSTVFGWKFDVMKKMNYALTGPDGDKAIGGGVGPALPGHKPGVTFYITVDDLQAYLDRAVKAGGKVVLEPTVISEEIGSCALFSDLDGNVIGIYKAP